MKSRTVFLVFLGLAVLWTWPAAWPSGIPGRWPDALGTVWFIDASPRLWPDLVDPLTGWPASAHYGRPDSFVLLLLSSILAFFPPGVIYSLVSVLGIALSAWAAERLAVELGAEAPWSLVAGVGFALCGLSSTSLIEGYPYLVLNPWMPWMVVHALRCTRPAATPQDGVLTGIFFTLTLLSSAWLALSAALLLLGLTPLLVGRTPKRPALPAALAAATVLGAGVIYVAVFVAAGDGVRQTAGNTAAVLSQLRLSLVQLAGPGLGVDVRWHSQTHSISATVLALAVLAPAVLRRGRAWKALLGVGLVSLLLSISPRVSPEAFADMPGAGQLALMLASTVLRFPARLGWAWALCASVVGALVATQLGRRSPKTARVIFVFVLIDAFVIMRQPLRQGEHLATVPSAYSAHTGPVLDIFPDDAQGSPAWLLWTTNLACHHQTVHHRAIAEHCLFTPDAESPRVLLQRVVVDRALAGDASETMVLLGTLGFGSVVVHLDAFSETDRAALLAGLTAAAGPAVLSQDGGEDIAAFGVLDKSSPDVAAAAWATWRAGGAGP